MGTFVIVNLPVKLCKLWELLGNTKRIIIRSDFCTKPLFCGHDQNLNPILMGVRLSKNFLKIVVPTILEFVCKIVICSSSHIIL
ncbi:hypothetical protein FFZ99_00570 [Leptospira interrogans]|nr:hypothetical protein FF006_06660 [Leptospira interrogans]TQE65852.1 hypothetical protein FFZ99_00570 [Leptospira interrogans]TQE68354.1 hypothetical protein FF001_03200 [Leptospira interrogans]TQE75659.1 hypothetical protein FF002_02145 [Leptospira interrogans]